jgi:hypothetical protein
MKLSNEVGIEATAVFTHNSAAFAVIISEQVSTPVVCNLLLKTKICCHIKIKISS